MSARRLHTSYELNYIAVCCDFFSIFLCFSVVENDDGNFMWRRSDCHGIVVKTHAVRSTSICHSQGALIGSGWGSDGIDWLVLDSNDDDWLVLDSNDDDWLMLGFNDVAWLD